MMADESLGKQMHMAEISRQLFLVETPAAFPQHQSCKNHPTLQFGSWYMLPVFFAYDMHGNLDSAGTRDCGVRLYFLCINCLKLGIFVGAQDEKYWYLVEEVVGADCFNETVFTVHKRQRVCNLYPSYLNTVPSRGVEKRQWRYVPYSYMYSTPTSAIPQQHEWVHRYSDSTTWCRIRTAGFAVCSIDRSTTAVIAFRDESIGKSGYNMGGVT